MFLWPRASTVIYSIVRPKNLNLHLENLLKNSGAAKNIYIVYYRSSINAVD